MRGETTPQAARDLVVLDQEAGGLALGVQGIGGDHLTGEVQ